MIHIKILTLVPVMAMTHVVSGMLNGLGLQSQSLRISLLSNLLCVLLMYLLPAMRPLRIYGAILANAGAQAVTLCLSLRALHHKIKKECTFR